MPVATITYWKLCLYCIRLSVLSPLSVFFLLIVEVFLSSVFPVFLSDSCSLRVSFNLFFVLFSPLLRFWCVCFSPPFLLTHAVGLTPCGEPGNNFDGVPVNLVACFRLQFCAPLVVRPNIIWEIFPQIVGIYLLYIRPPFSRRVPAGVCPSIPFGEVHVHVSLFFSSTG